MYVMVCQRTLQQIEVEKEHLMRPFGLELRIGRVSSDTSHEQDHIQVVQILLMFIGIISKLNPVES